MLTKRLPLLVLLSLAACAPALLPAEETRVFAREQTWEERMLAGLDRKLTLAFEDTPLADALDTLAALSGVNIVVDPKVRAANPKVKLSVAAMDAATVLYWLTTLTNTHLLLLDRALYVTAAHPPEATENERQDLLLLALAHGVDASVAPPPGLKVSDADLMRLALAIWDKTNPPLTQFPAPQDAMLLKLTP